MSGARATDPWTSHAADASAKAFSGNHRAKILSVLRGALLGLTVYEIGERIRLDHVSVARRMSELERCHHAYTEGDRPGPNGRACRVWFAATLEAQS